MTDEDFINYIKDEIETDEYCKILRKKREHLMINYIVEKSTRNISFHDYLKERVEELKYLNILGKRRKKLYSDYISWYGYASEITFYEYLKGLVIIEVKCKILKKSEKNIICHKLNLLNYLVWEKKQSHVMKMVLFKKECTII